MFEKEENGIVRHWMYLLGDMLAIQLSLLIAYKVNGSIGSISVVEHYKCIAIGSVVVSFIVIFFSENYKGITHRGYFKEFKSVAYFTAMVFYLMLAVFFVLKISAVFSRLFIGIWFVLSVDIIYLMRIAIKIIMNKFFKNLHQKNIMIITKAPIALEERNFVLNSLNDAYKIVAFGFLEQGNKESTGDTDYIFGAKEIVQYALKQTIDEVLVIDTSFTATKQLVESLLAMGITVHYHLYDEDIHYSKSIVSTLGHMNVITIYNNVISERNLFVKRTMDICGAIVGLIITIPIAVVICPIIYKTSPGNVLFIQERVGRNGRTFKLYKFRSMYLDAEERKAELMKDNEMDGFMFKLTNDPRITPIGHFIRKTSIDELPQFINVLKGDMSLVGTRPPTVEEYQQYQLHHKSRLAMRPGITGMWQVAGRSNITDFEDIVKLDRSYIDNWNLGLDIKLLLKTVKVVLLSQGAR